MNVLITLPRGTLRKTFGGAEIQAIKTAKFLSQRGIEVRIAETDQEPKSLSDCDIVHTFDHSDALYVSRAAKRMRKKLVFTPIYWPEKGKGNVVQKMKTYMAMENPQFLFNQLRKPYSMAFYLAWRLLPKWADPIKQLTGNFWLYPFRVADSIIVNSAAEKAVLGDVIGREIESKIEIVHNGVDDEIYGKQVTERTRRLFPSRYGMQNYVLSVGRIEPRKNQIALVRACKKLGLPCVLVGRPYDRYYADKVLQDLRAGSIEYRHISYLKSDSDMLISAYLNARVVALPSTMETPGLVALEAASLGRTIVVTEIGSASEYFMDNAYYVNPDYQTDVTARIEQAWNNPFDEGCVRRFVLENYTWRKAANSIIQIYEELTNS